MGYPIFVKISPKSAGGSSLNTSVDSTIAYKFLLTLGILAPIVKIATDVFAIRMWKGYSFVSQSISELSASGAPTRSTVLLLDLLFDLLIVAFAIGLWQQPDQSHILRIVSALIVANAVISFFVTLFIPMQINSDGISSASTIHVVLMAIGVFSFMAAMGLAGFAFDDWIRYVSLGILVAYFVLAGIRLILPSGTIGDTEQVTSGIQERTMVLGYLFWLCALSVHQILLGDN